MNKMYYIRHGENPANITKEFSHRKVDYPLTQKGVLQARQTADFFLGRKIDFIYSSPMKRTMETAQIISGALKKNVHVVEELRELNIGRLEDSSPTKEAWDQFDSVTADWGKGVYDSSFPGGENYNTLLNRFKSALMSIFGNKNGCDVIVVGHGGIIYYAIEAICSGQDISGQIADGSHNCSISEFEIEIRDDNIYCQLLKWGSHAHLSGDAALFIPGTRNK